MLLSARIPLWVVELTEVIASPLSWAGVDWGHSVSIELRGSWLRSLCLHWVEGELTEVIVSPLSGGGVDWGHYISTQQSGVIKIYFTCTLSYCTYICKHTFLATKFPHSVEKRNYFGQNIKIGVFCKIFWMQIGLIYM